MTRIMKVKKNFTPFQIMENDELYQNGFFQFNITKILEYISQNLPDFPLDEIDVTEHHKLAFSNINESHIDSVVITVPIVLAEISPERYNVIDGHHRLEKAYINGMKMIKAYKLKGEQLVHFITTEKAYHAYVNYWNDKLKG